ncbi:MAG: hypothetical protein JXM70_26920, partial [Pirellulales bacterium]|nr:hypothetical protein [Pirellulales bacterium]
MRILRLFLFLFLVTVTANVYAGSDHVWGTATIDHTAAITWPKLYGAQVKPQPKRNPSKPETDKQGRKYIEAAANLKLKDQAEVTVILRRYTSAEDAA